MRLALALGCWLISTLAGLVVGVAIRQAVLQVSLAVHVDHYALGLVDKTAIVALVLIWLIGAMVGEPYYDGGAKEGRLRRRFLAVSGVQVGLGVVAMVAQQVAQRLG